MVTSTTEEITPRRGTTRRTRAIIGAFVALLLAPLGVVLVTAGPAAAIDENCIGKVQLRKSGPMSATYWYIRSDDTVKLTANVMYWDCPNGTQLRKVRPRWIAWCWTFNDARGEHEFFDGMEGNVKMEDTSGKLVNPPAFHIPDKYDNQNCLDQEIPFAQEKWFTLQDNPDWIGAGRLILIDMADQVKPLKDPYGSTVKLFTPMKDEPIGEPFEP